MLLGVFILVVYFKVLDFECYLCYCEVLVLVVIVELELGDVFYILLLWFY